MKIVLDGVSVECREVGATSLTVEYANGTRQDQPCARELTTDEGARAVALSDAGVRMTPFISIDDPAGMVFRFVSLPVDFTPGAGGCAEVTDYVLHATVGDLVIEKGARCDAPAILPTLDMDVTIDGFVETGAGRRACHRTPTPVARKLASGETTAVDVPFAPAPVDVEACAGHAPPVCIVDDGCELEEICDNGADDNCDGFVDEGCTCAAGAVQACFRGPPLRRGKGACSDGTQTCLEGTWSSCEGGIAPKAELCDGLDNDCNLCADDNITCTTPTLACPASSAMPSATPYSPYVIDASSWVTGQIVSWKWTVVGGPCDDFLQQTSGKSSFTLTGANTPILTFRPTLSGDYTVTLEATAADGTTFTCTFVVHANGPGLRVELCWDTTGTDDLDLRLHRPGSTAPWTLESVDNCNYQNCAPFATTPPAWYPPSPLEACGGANGPWTFEGSCPNPRLDVDNINSLGVPENINVDVPEADAAYRVLVHYYGSTNNIPHAVHPMVNVYCDGARVATFGQTPDVVPGYDTPGGSTGGDMWRVADITFDQAGKCVATPLHPPGQTEGYFVTTGDLSY